MGNAAEELEVQSGHLPRTLVRVRIDDRTQNNFWTPLEGDLGQGGVFVATHRILPIGALVALEIRIGRSVRTFEALGTVRWSRPYRGDQAPPGFGVEFVDVDAGVLFRMRTFCAMVREPILFDE